MRIEDTGTIGGSEGPKLPGEPAVSPDDVGLPKAKGMSLSYWLQGVRNRPLLNHRTTEDLPKHSDVVIIGSGMSGTLAALKLLESDRPPTSVTILEAREFCSGATGRNAGHCRPDQYRGFAKYSRLHGDEQAIKVLDNERETWEKLVAYVRENNVDCDLWTGRSYEVSTSVEVAKQSAEIFDCLVAAGGKTDHITRILDPLEAEKLSRFKGAQAIYHWDASTLYPWKLTAHIAHKALELGLNLQTWTTVTAVNQSGDSADWDIVTDRGTVTTPTVLFATNAYTGALLPETISAIRPAPHMCNKVIPPTSFSGSKALRNSYGLIYPNGHSYSVNPRSSSDGVVLVGGWNPNYGKMVDYISEDSTRRYDDGLTDFEPVTEAVRDMTRERFGWTDDFAEGTAPRYDYAWSGIIGRSGDEVPFIGAIPGKRGQWICAGHNGHGMARIFTAAPGAVKLMQGAKWADTGLPDCFEVTRERLDRLSECAASIHLKI